MTVLTGKEAQQMIALIYDLNQDLKNAKKDNTYTILKGKLMAFKTDPEDLVHIVATPILSKTRQPAEPYLPELNGFIHGKELFAFFKDYKKFTTDIHLSADGFIIKTSVPEVEYVSGSVRENRDKDFDPYKEFTDRVLKPYRTKECLKASIDITDRLKEIDDAPSPVTIEAKKIRLKVTHRIFLGLKAKSTCSMKFFCINKKNGVYLIQMTMNNPSFTSENYFVIVNY